MEMLLPLNSTMSNGDNVKRKLVETSDEHVLAKKSKTIQSSLTMDATQTDVVDDENDDGDRDDDEDDEEEADDDDEESGDVPTGDTSGTDDVDTDNNNTCLTSNNCDTIANTTICKDKDRMMETTEDATNASTTMTTSVPTITPMTSTKPETSMASVSPLTLASRNFTVIHQNERIECPLYGQLVNRREFRRAGPYLIGLKLGHSPVDSIVQYLAKKENTNEFYQLKILVLNNNTSSEKLLQDERQGKMLLHTEYSLLSLLQNEDGVMQQYGLFSDMAYEEVQAENFTNNNFYTGGLRKRLVLVLDCVTSHDFDPKSSAFINLQQYLINRKKLHELEALKIFYEIVKVVENLHARNVIHRDLKLGNIVLNKRTNKVKIINFCLGKYLLNENELLYDQRGSPAYISPDVLCGKPYKGKPSDMWALGVVLFMMLYRQFPFFESTPAELFKKIKSAEYLIPINSDISVEAEQLIKGLLQLNADRRLTATKVRQRLARIIESHSAAMSYNDCIVPDCSRKETKTNQSRRQTKYRHSSKRSSMDSSNHDQIVPTHSDASSTPPSHPSKRTCSTTYLQPTATPILTTSIPSSERIDQVPQPMSHPQHHAFIIHNQIPMLNLLSSPINHFIRRYNQQRLRSSLSSNDSMKRLFDTFNTMYIRGRIPNQNRTNLHPFNGFITDDLAKKIIMWLAQMPEPHSAVQRLFTMQQLSPVANIEQFLRCCGFATETVQGQTKIKREQTLDLLMVITYLLQAAGYSNAYFVAV